MSKLLSSLPLAALLAAASACAAPPIPHGHPANPSTPASPLPAASQVLSSTKDGQLFAPSPEEAGAAGHHAHGAHNGAAPNPHAENAAKEPKAAPDPRAGHAVPDAREAATYVCPMHAEVTSTKAGERCPKCGMGLVEKGGGR